MSNKKIDILVCPVCGFSFKREELNPKTKRIKCPKCGHEFNNSTINPLKPDLSQRKI